MTNSLPLPPCQPGKCEPPWAQREFPASLVVDLASRRSSRGDNGTRLPPGAVAVSPLPTPPFTALSVVEHATRLSATTQSAMLQIAYKPIRVGLTRVTPAHLRRFID